MVQVKLNKSNDNPFYGLKNCLKLFQSVGNTIDTALLDACWSEVRWSKEHKQMFFSLLFSIGDITARQHNIFKGIKKDSGGNANREGFQVVLEWMWKKHQAQFVKFLEAGLFNEYTCFDLLFRNRVQTKGSRVTRIHNLFAEAKYREVIASYLYKVINGNNPFNRTLVAKFLTLPRVSKRSSHSKMLPETKKVMEDKVKLLIMLSEFMGWEYEVNEGYANFKGYRKWRKDYNGDLESVLFSTGKINEFDKQSFIDWFDKLPSQARFRVKNRILYSKIKDTEEAKYSKFQPWLAEWEKYKESKQAEQRVLEEKVRQGQATEEDKIKLKKVAKQAKVTVGATNFKELYNDICYDNVDKLKLETFMTKVNLPYNSLVIIDDSGSMHGKPFNFATFLASVCLCKNPDDDGRNLLGFFNSRSHWHTCIDRKNNSVNSFIRSETVKTKQTPFVDPKKSFYENYQSIKSFCKAVFQGGCTYISNIPDDLHKECQNNPQILDALKNYPVWTIISDGEWNSLKSPEASMNAFMMKCQRYFGFKPYIVAIDVDGGWSFNSASIDRFEGIENMIYIPANVAQIEQFLTNFKDMDIMDVYTPLQSLFRSNRYDIVREGVL
nr:MAG TPA: cobalamin biosynthesis protein [Crassvirales sp.]